jgi:peptidoglycan/LPS O-acetylase OafA/YrhL
MLFINAWHPALIPTLADRWTVVPGGWSIGVEFTFYALFPLIAVYVRSMRSALSFGVLALVLGSVVNPIAQNALVGRYGETATNNFLYFWFPNQATVFALGTILFYALRRTWDVPDGRVATFLRQHATGIVLICAVLCVAAANCPFPGRLPLALPLVLPTMLVASLVFMVTACALGNSPKSIFNNAAVRVFGKVSFSAYILHFAVLHKLPVLLPVIFDVRHVTGWNAILTFVALWAVTVPLTFGLSYLTYSAIEEPMIGAGRRLLVSRRLNLESMRISGVSGDGPARRR